MVFRLTIFDKAAQFRKFMFMPDKMETGLDFVSDLVAKGEILLKVLFDENNKQTELPLHIFDGSSFLAPMQDLKQAWEALLHQPVRAITAANQELMDLTQKRLALCENRLTNQRSVIRRFETLLQRAEAKSDVDVTRSFLIRQYQHQIRVYTQQSTQSRLRLEGIRKRLKALS